MIGRAIKAAATWIWEHIMAALHQCRLAILALAKAEGRRAWALVALWGAGVVMTIYASRALWYVREQPSYVFWLGIMAHISIIIVITGFAGLLVKRTIHGKITGVAEFGVDDEDVTGKESTTTAVVTTTTTNDKQN